MEEEVEAMAGRKLGTQHVYKIPTPEASPADLARLQVAQATALCGRMGGWGQVTQRKG